MKKFFLIALTASFLGTGAFAATTGDLYCGGAGYNTTGGLTTGSNTVVCPNFVVGGGFQLTSIVLTYYLDYSYAGPAVPNSVSVSFDPTPNALFTPDITPLTQAGNGSSPGVLSASASQTLLLVGPALSTGPTVLLTPSNFSLNGANSSASANVYINYTYSEIPSTEGVPEPTSVALIGAGLVGLAAVARRRRQ